MHCRRGSPLLLSYQLQIRVDNGGGTFSHYRPSSLFNSSRLVFVTSHPSSPGHSLSEATYLTADHQQTNRCSLLLPTLLPLPVPLFRYQRQTFLHLLTHALLTCAGTPPLVLYYPTSSQAHAQATTHSRVPSQNPTPEHTHESTPTQACLSRGIDMETRRRRLTSKTPACGARNRRRW